MNQAIFERIWVSEDGVAGVDLQLPFSHLLAHDLTERLEHETASAQAYSYKRLKPHDLAQRPSGPFAWENKNDCWRSTKTFYTSAMVPTCLVWWALQDSNRITSVEPTVNVDAQRFV
jgi:hypothetical protein